MDVMDRINAALASPKTHRVVATYACGKVRTLDTRNASSAETHAEMERRKIGRELIERDDDTLMLTGRMVSVVSVAVERIAA